jgi:hypothetical protein
LPAALEEGFARPQDDRRRECELQPVVRLLIQHGVQVRKVAAHFERDDGHREGQTDPEAPRHVGEFGIWSLRCACDSIFGFERHTAFRA